MGITMQGLKDLKKEIIAEAINVEVDLIKIIVDTLESYSPQPGLSKYSTGTFLRNLRIQIGDRTFTLENNTQGEIKAVLWGFQSGSIRIYNDLGYADLVEWIGWYGYKGNNRVWESAKHPPYKPMGIALRAAEEAFRGIVADNNRVI